MGKGEFIPYHKLDSLCQIHQLLACGNVGAVTQCSGSPEDISRYPRQCEFSRFVELLATKDDQGFCFVICLLYVQLLFQILFLLKTTGSLPGPCLCPLVTRAYFRP